MHTYKILEQGSPLEKAQKAIILLHGRGADARDIISLAPYFADDTFYIAAPEATRNSWYPHSFLVPVEQNEPWLSSAIDTVKKLLDSITEKIPTENIYLMGFSQGACLSLETAARYPARYGGVAAFTGGLIGEKAEPERYTGDFHGTSIFIGNSDCDPHIPESRTAESAKILQNMNANVIYKVYPDMPHTINDDEIEVVRKMVTG